MVADAPILANGHYRVDISYQKHGEGDFVPLTQQQWWHDAESRHLGFVANRGGRLPRLYLYRDFRPDGTQKAVGSQEGNAR